MIHDVCNNQMLELVPSVQLSSSEYYCEHCHKSIPMPRSVAESINSKREYLAKLAAQQAAQMQMQGYGN